MLQTVKCVIVLNKNKSIENVSENEPQNENIWKAFKHLLYVSLNSIIFAQRKFLKNVVRCPRVFKLTLAVMEKQSILNHKKNFNINWKKIGLWEDIAQMKIAC